MCVCECVYKYTYIYIYIYMLSSFTLKLLLELKDPNYSDDQFIDRCQLKAL